MLSNKQNVRYYNIFLEPWLFVILLKRIHDPVTLRMRSRSRPPRRHVSTELHGLRTEQRYFSTAPSSGWKVCGEPQRVGYTYSRAKLPQTSSGSNLFSKRCSKAGTRWCYSSRKPHNSHISFSLSQIYTNIWEVSFIKEKKRLHSNHIWRLTIK